MNYLLRLICSVFIIAISDYSYAANNQDEIKQLQQEIKKVELNTSNEAILLKKLINKLDKTDSVNLKINTISMLLRNSYNRNLKDSVKYLSKKVVPLALKQKRYDKLFDALSMECFAELYAKNYEFALKKAEETYDLASSLDSNDGIVASKECLGAIYNTLNQHKEAIRYFSEALDIQEKMGNRHAYEIQLHTYLIDSSIKISDFERVKNSLIKFRKIIDNFKNGIYKNEVRVDIDRAEWLYHSFCIRFYVEQNKKEKALEHLRIASLYLWVPDTFVYYYFHYSAALYYRLIKDYKSALIEINLAMVYETNDDMYFLKGEILSASGNDIEAANCFRTSAIIKDTTHLERSTRQLNQFNTIHHVDKLNLKTKQLQIKNKQFQIQIFIIIVVLLLFLLLSFTYYNMCLRRDKEKLLRSEKDLRKAKEKAEAADRLKTAFVQNISHEIRTPLNAIVGFADILTENIKNIEQQEYADIIRDNSNILLKLVNDILDFSRMEANQLVINKRPCEIVSHCKKALASIDSAISPNVKVRFESVLHTFVIQTDELRLQQLLLNLLSNASKFTDKGEICLALESNQKIARITITDTGCGIPIGKQNKIFERFEKLNEFKQGTGLGLSICKGITENLGGTIHLDTSYQNGAKFVVELPIE